MLGSSWPVPSPAALRALRRLAYISSGTICGTAALVVEEQRRRAHLARRMADNAAKLRQHPRRMRSTSRTIHVDLHDSTTRERSSEDEPITNTHWHDRTALHRLHTPRAPFLPSEVDMQYARLSRHRSFVGGHTVVPGSRRTLMYDVSSHRTDPAYDFAFRPGSLPSLSTLGPGGVGRKLSQADVTRQPSQGSASKDVSGESQLDPLSSNLPELDAAIDARDIALARRIIVGMPTEQRSTHVAIGKLLTHLIMSRDFKNAVILADDYKQVFAMNQAWLVETIIAYRHMERFNDGLDLLSGDPLQAMRAVLDKICSSAKKLMKAITCYQAMHDRLADLPSQTALHNHMLRLCIRFPGPQSLETFLQIRSPCSELQIDPDLDLTGIKRLLITAVNSRHWSLVYDFIESAGVRYSDEERRMILIPFLEHHASSCDTSDLVATCEKLQERCGQLPNRMIRSIVLQGAIRNGDLSPALAWFENLARAGIDTGFDSRDATKAFQQLYKFRLPSRTQLSTLLETLRQYTPELVSDDMEVLLAEAAAHDLRLHKSTFANRAKLLASREATIEASAKLMSATSSNTVGQPIRLYHTTATSPSCRSTRVTSDQSSNHRVNERAYVQMLLDSTLGGQGPSLLRLEADIAAGLAVSSPAIVDLAMQWRVHQRGQPDGDTITGTDRDPLLKASGTDPSTCVPVVVDRLRSLAREPNSRFRHMLAICQDYYSKMEAAGRAYTHHVSVTAARQLMGSNRAREGVQLLHAVHASYWGVTKPLDIVAMTVLLQGYVTLRCRQGLDWTLKHVMTSNMRIDLKFSQELGKSRKMLLLLVRDRPERTVERELADALEVWQKAVHERRTAQNDETEKLGRQIVNLLVGSRSASAGHKVQPFAIGRARAAKRMMKRGRDLTATILSAQMTTAMQC